MLDWLREKLTPEQRRFVKFCVVGASGVVVNLAFLELALWLLPVDMTGTMRNAVASAIGIVVSVFTNFIINDVWTWADREKGTRKRDFVGRVAMYYVASAAAVALQWGVAMATSEWLGWDIRLGQLAGIALGTIVNYVINNVWTFRDTGASATPEEGDEQARHG